MSEKDPVNRIRELLEKQLNGTASPAESSELQDWKDQSADNARLHAEWMDPATRETKLFDYMQIDAGAEAEGRVWRNNLPREVTDQFPGSSARVLPLRKILYAAAIIGCIAVLSVKYLDHRPGKVVADSAAPVAHNDIAAPTGSKTILTLAGGARILLDSAQNGIVSRQGNTEITKDEKGQLVYKASQPGTNGRLNDHTLSVAISYNTLSTGMGGQTQLMLADGTQVWLNSGSSITYPTVFSGKDRRVTITGEAYFEVAKDKTRAFFAQALDMRVEVLGTHFNFNAYKDEGGSRTTLLEGSVKVMAMQGADVAQGGGAGMGSGGSGGGVMLRPGQQAQMGKDGGIRKTDRVDTDQAIAWLNGKFAFDSEKVPVILRQLARWYDLEIAYEGPQPEIQLTASLSKRSSLSAVLKVLELSGVHCRLEGKKLIVK